jgi:hypothetical protein
MSSILSCLRLCSETPAQSTIRGDLQSPNTESGADGSLKSLKRVRVLTAKVKPSPEQWKRLRELAWQAMQYKNHCARALWAQAIGLRVDPEKGDKNDISKHIRKTQKGELSAAVYDAAETEVKGAWQRDAKKIMAGAPFSQWRHNDSLSVRDTGITVLSENDQFFISLSVQNKDCEGGCRMVIPFADGTQTDKFLSPILSGMVSGSIKPLRATLIFKPDKGKTLIKVAYALNVMVPPVGERVATLSNINGRVMLRAELAQIDYTAKLTTFTSRKQQWDAIRRRVTCQIGKRKGHARTKRKVFERVHFDDWSKTHMHQWSREVIDWCASHHIGKIVLLDLAGGDWPAHLFEQFLTYKGKDCGIDVVNAISEGIVNESTERATKAEVKRAQRKARKLGDSVRTLSAEMA